MRLHAPRSRVPASRGFGLLEALMSIALFVIIGFGLYQSFAGLLLAVQISRAQLTATELLQEQVEVVRNLPYSDVGEVAGIPSGKLQSNKTVTRSGQTFSIDTTVQNVDDPADGTIGGTPHDLSPADYKRVQITVNCTNCKDNKPVSFTTTQAPKSLEGSSTNGALFIRALDSSGQPVAGAAVHVVNQQPNPDIVIDDVTDNDGWLEIIDAPPGDQVYEITVTKAGYSTDKTYPPGDAGNPNPLKAHATVLAQQVTQATFSIDVLGTVNVSTVTDTCTPVGNMPFTLTGSKTIGTSPTVYKYDQSLTTNGSGLLTLPNMEWNTYTAVLTSGSYYLAGGIAPNPFTLAPGGTQDFKMIVAPKNPNALVVTVKDGSTSLPVSDASVTLTKGGYTGTALTGRGFLGQTDWSGGSGQDAFADATKYFDSDGNVDVSSPTGEIKLKNTLGTYASSGQLTSSTFDTGSVSNFHDILWQATVQPPQTGTDSVKFQIATNIDQTTWNFYGPDGTPSTYYTATNTNINPLHSNDRYLRYRAYLSTEDTAYTPDISDVNFTYTSECVPPGQVLFDGLGSGTYTVTVSKSGYTTYTDANVSVASGRSEYVVTLTP